MWIVNVALRRPYTFVVAALLLVLASPFVVRNMATDIFPKIDIPVVGILWQYGGLSAKEMADRITGPSERGFGQVVTDIEHTESQSLSGLSVIKVFFQPGTDIRSALTQLLASTTAALRTMPLGTQPPQVYQISATDLPVLQLGMSSLVVPDTEVGDLAMNTVRNRLVTIPGASITFPYGSKNRQLSVDLDGPSLLARGLTPSDVTDAIGTQNLILPTGSFKLADTEYDVELNGAVGSVPLIGDIPIRTVNGSTTFVRDIAQVRDGASPQTTIVRQNGDRGVLLSIFKNSSVSTLELVKSVYAALPALLEELPKGIELKPMFDQSLFVNAAIANVVHEGLIAATLTAAMILLFLGNWRSTCIIAISIPLSILSSLIVLYLIGQTLNLMTLGGLALAVGILVDDATVEIENIERQISLGKNPRQAILDGAAEIAVPAFVSTLSICIVFVPLFLLTGVARFLFVPLAEAVMFAMIASYILSRTLIPTLVMFMTSSHEQHRGRSLLDRFHGYFNRGFHVFRQYYVALLTHTLNAPRKFAFGFIGFSLLSVGLYPLLGEDLFPAVDAGQLRLHLRAPPGIRVEEMPGLVDRVEKFIRATIPPRELGNVLDIVGGPYSPRNTLFGNSGTADSSDTEIMVSLKPGEHGPTQQYIDKLRAALPREFPGIEFSFQPADQVSQSLNFGTPAPIDIQIVGNKLADNLALAIALNNELRKVPGVVDAHVHQRANKPAISLEMDRSQLQQVGLSAKDVAQNLLISLSGSMQTAPSYWLNPTNGNTYNVGVQSKDGDIDSLDTLLRTPIAGSISGQSQLLGNLVKVKRAMRSPIVSHYNITPVIDVFANVQGRDLGSVGRDIERLVETFRPQLRGGTDIVIRGQYQTMQSSYRALALGIVVSVVLVYLLVVVNFQSWLDPLIVIAALPAALAGILWMLFISGTPVSVPALTGAIMTIGVATANSILLVSFARSRQAAGVPPSIAAREAGATRLRPVLMTALAMIVGMLPMALGIGEGAEQNAPLGRAVIGGLVFATVSTLLFVPVVFAGLHELTLHRHGGLHGAAPFPARNSL